MSESLNMPTLMALVVEDDPDLKEIFEMALEEAGYQPMIISDGQVALDTLPTIKPHLIVLDLHLPHVSGAEILDQIRATAHLEKTRVILTTANSRWADELRPKADLVLDKPVSYRQLRDFALRFR